MDVVDAMGVMGVMGHLITSLLKEPLIKFSSKSG